MKSLKKGINSKKNVSIAAKSWLWSSGSLVLTFTALSSLTDTLTLLFLKLYFEGSGLTSPIKISSKDS